MNIHTSYEYLQHKKALLKQCLTLSEELISSIEDWEPVPDILSKREAVILQLQELEETTSARVKATLTKEMKMEMDQMIKLILDLDKDASNRIRKEQKEIIESLKTNTKEQKLVQLQYGQTSIDASGRKLDYKK